MARAKRTDRADARRRYRQLQGLDEAELEAEGALEPEVSPAPRRAASSAERPSITGAFRNAYRPANIREDIGLLPQLVRTRSFLLSILLVVGGTVAVAVAPTNAITTLVFQAFVVPPAMAPIFVVGFFARRASYLLGLIVAVVDVVAYGALLYTVIPTLPAETPMTADQQQALLVSALSIGPISGVFFAAAAAWYRRFLNLSNANAAARARQRAEERAREQKAKARAAGKPARG